MRKGVLYLGLKGSNLLVSTVWNFALVFVLVRTLDPTNYSAFIVSSAIAGYLSIGDLGLTSVAYGKLRAFHLSKATGSDESHDLTTLLLLVYGAIAAVACGIFASVQMLHPSGHGDQAGAFIVYFAGLTLGLPWNMVRTVLMATDHYLKYECVEFARRIAAIVSVYVLWRGEVEFMGFAALNFAGWILAYAAVSPQLFAVVRRGKLNRWDAVARTVRGNLRQGYQTSLFALSEFAMFNACYVVMPLLFGVAGAGALIAYDVFVKVQRFGAQSNFVAFESVLPSVTRSIHAGNASGLERSIRFGLSVAGASAAAGALLVLVAGDRIFGALLGNEALIPAWLRVCMAVTLVADALRACGALILMNTGKVASILRPAVFGIGSLVALAIVGGLVHLSFQSFMIGYVSIFAITSCTYLWMLTGRMLPAFKAGIAW